MNRHITTTLAGLLLGTCLVAGCEKSASEPAPALTTAAGTDGLPVTLFTAAAPDGATALLDAKTGAKAGDHIVFEARVGGRRDAFVEGRAVFFVADAALLSCDQLHGDSCKTPWDYCCEPRDNLLANMATVQVVDGDGQPLRVSLENVWGLAGLRTIVVSGTVAQADDAGNFVVNADRIHVKAGAAAG